MTYCELPNIEECCGFGGTFSVKMPGASLAMGQTKVENIVKSGADVVVSNDVSCLMHIGGILRRIRQREHIRTMHIADVLVAGWEDEKNSSVNFKSRCAVNSRGKPPTLGGGATCSTK